MSTIYFIYFILLFYFILFYFILFYFILFYFILFLLKYPMNFEISYECEYPMHLVFVELVSLVYDYVRFILQMQLVKNICLILKR